MKSSHLFSVISALALFLSACQPGHKGSGDLFSAVPKNSTVVIAVENLYEGLGDLQHTKMYAELDSLPFMMGFARSIRSLSSEFDEDTLKQYFRKNPVLIVAALSGAEKYNLLFIGHGNPDLEATIGRKMSKGYQVRKKTYSDAEVFHFYKEDNSKSYHVSAYRDLLLFSTNGNLLEESIRQLNSEFNLRKDAGFQKLYETSNKKDLANVYVNLRETPGLLKKLLPLANSEYLKRMGSWAELDVQVYDEELIMSGLTLLPNQEAWYPQSFNGVSAQKTTGQQVVPTSTGIWISHTFENAEQYYRNYREYLEKAGRLRKHDQLLEKLEFDHEKFLLNWVDNEMGIFGSAGKTGQDNYVAYFRYRSEEDVTQALEQLASPDFIEGYRGMIIKKMTAENALARFYGSLYSDFHYPYYTISNGFVLFAENLPMLKGVINDIVDGKTLDRDEDFAEFNGKIPSKSHIRIIASNPGFLPLLGNTLEGSDAKIMEKNGEDLNNFRWAALQMNVDGDAAFTNFYMVHSATKKEKVSRQWSTQLETEAANVPQLLKNHVNKKYDIAIQDKDHRLYLLDNSGKILWTKILDGPIIGNITQVDLYKNNKLQMVLNTRTKLYVIDRLGNDVENFPVTLEEPASAPVGVFNYDLARNYRFVIPVGNDLKNYDMSGKPVKGWKFKKTGSPIVTQPQHFAVRGKDVIVVETEEGNLFQLNRTGAERFTTIKELPKLRIPFYLKEGKSLAESEMLTIADDGKLYAFQPGGTADALYLDEENPAEYFLYFDDKYIFTHEEKLFVKSDDKPWTATMESDISTKPKAMIFRGNFYAGAFSRDAEEIRLYDNKGSLIDGFPVFAQGPFDMGSLKVDASINIVTYSEDGTLICYRVN